MTLFVIILVIKQLQKMDHFIDFQKCIHCSKGGKFFKVDLTCYDADGTVIITSNDMERFRFTCLFCHKKTTLDFYGSFDQNFISYLKNLHKRNRE